MGTILSQGDFGQQEQNSIRRAARQLESEVTFVERAEQAERWLEQNTPEAILLSGIGEEACHVASRARFDAEKGRAAIIAVTRQIDDEAFAAAMSWGADDLILRSNGLQGLVPRLAAAKRSVGRSFSPRRGKALVGEPVLPRRAAIRRVLVAAGFSVREVETPHEVTQGVLDLGIGLCVVASSLCEDVEGLLDKARERGVMGKLIVTADGERLTQLAALLSSREGVRVLQRSSPADHVIFLANEMTCPEFDNQRTAPRSLLSTVVRFGGTGEERREMGYSYNVSSWGIYIRTMAPPESSTAWIELVAPGTERVLRLQGDIVWRRPFGADGNATAPPGFGMQLTGPEEELGAWQRAIGSLQHQHVTPKGSVPAL